MTKAKIKEFFSNNRQRNNLIIAAGFAVLLVGVLMFATLTMAGGFFAATEPENGTRTGNAQLVADGSASGGSAVQFTAPAAPPPPPSNGCASNVSGSSPACTLLPPAPLPAGKHWNVSFSEEFNGSDYDHSKLTPCFDWNYGGCTSSFNQGREHYDPSQVVVGSGTAKLIAAPLSPAYASTACQTNSCTYKAGLLSTARPNAGNGSDYTYKFTYGYIESSFKFPATQGFFTAFWMLPANPSYDYGTEIDILEVLGNDPKSMFMHYHYGTDRTTSYSPNNDSLLYNGACAVKDYSQNFVRMGVDWQPDHIAWYIDGVKCGQFSNASQIESGPMQLILHMMVDNNWQRSWGVGLKESDANLTRQLEVDYIRVYQLQ